MKRLSWTAVAFLLVGVSNVGLAQDSMHSTEAKHRNIGLGFHNVEAPVGLRWWFSGQKVGLDLGLGFSSSSAEDAGYPDEQLSSWAVDVGVPFVAHSWTRAHVLLRPGILYESDQVAATSPPVDFDTEDQTNLAVSLEIEGELFLVDNFSVSASHGIAFNSFDPGFGADNQTSFSTIGRNFTTVGFHMYFLGGE